MTDKPFDPDAIKRYQGCDVWNEDGSVAWGCDSGNEAGETAMVMASDYDSLLALYRELVPLRICAPFRKDAKDSNARMTGTKEPFWMDFWESL